MLELMLAASAACAGSAFYARLRDLPPDAREALPPMAEAGQSFQATDVTGLHQLPDKRFLAARQARRRLLVRFEYGGIARGVSAIVLFCRGDRWTVVGRRTRIEQPAPSVTAPAEIPPRRIQSSVVA